MARALIVVDVQNDFVEGGVLEVKGGRKLASDISSFLEFGPSYDLYIATKDWHIDPGTHFETWPPHCRANTFGADLCDPLDDIMFDFIQPKGMFSDGYSAFSERSLAPTLTGAGVSEVDIVGIAGDYCVKETALDAVKSGFVTSVLEYLTVSIGEFPREELRKAGVATYQA